MFKKFFIICFGILLNSTGFSGTEISAGGGNRSVNDFFTILRKAIQRLDDGSSLNFNGKPLDLKKMKNSLATLAVESTDRKLILNGVEVDAINYPDLNKIEFNTARWDQSQFDQKLKLVIHEFLGVNFGKNLDFQYGVTDILFPIVRKVSIEDLVSTMAIINLGARQSPEIVSSRTKVRNYFSDPQDKMLLGMIYTIFVKTFENNSPKSIRIYEVKEDHTGALREIRMIGGEGPIGP